MVRIANGCEVKEGFLVRVGLPTNWLALFQVIEYYRAFWIARAGLAPLNALLIISGAFGLFRKTAVVEAGGYAKGLHGEDMELIVRLHRHLRLRAQRYRISFVPHAFCWTEAPEHVRSLRNQRIRWQRGLAESLVMNRELLFHPRGGTVGWLALPIAILFEWLSPAVLVLGYLFTALSYATGLWSSAAVAAFLTVEIGMGMLMSASVLLVDELSFHAYPKFRQVMTLFLVAIVENLGFRQVVSCWRLIGSWRSLVGARSSWGEITRTAAWQSPKA
jgi:cellulose synthase/poly-beta-1,6-N-acetylglucosamine synthase-like glycosyltransferase